MPDQFAAPPVATATRPVWLHVGTLLDGTSTAPARDAHVVYDALGIRFVGTDNCLPPRDLLRPGQQHPDLVAPDATLLPGLVEAHAHLFLEGGELDPEKRAAYLRQSPADLFAAAHTRFARLIPLGITAVRDAGDKDGVGLSLARLSKGARSAIGPVSDLTTARSVTPATVSDPPLPSVPYLDSPGAAIHHQGRYGSFMADALENYPSPRASVEARVAAGADRIKLIPTGIINFKQARVTSEPQMTTEEIKEIVAAARSLGRQTFAHASGDLGIDRVIDGGVDSVEHGFFIRDDQLARLRDRQIAWVPTFAPVQKQIDHAAVMGWDSTITAGLRCILDRHAASLVKAHELGVILIAGSDAGSYGVPHGLGLLDELELMSRAGLPALAVINAATGAGAHRLAFQEKFGRIAPGWRGRMILTRHSPLESIANLRLPRIVIYDGTVHLSSTPSDPTGL